MSRPLSFILTLVGLGIGAYVIGATSQVEAQTQTTDDYAGYFQTVTAKRAKQNWMLNCMGCHKVDGSGHKNDSFPDLNNHVAKYLHVDGGREYLMQVPGVVNAAINEEDLAHLLNWTLIVFDPDNIPKDHVEYTGEEIAKFRSKPLSVKAPIERERLINLIAEREQKSMLNK